METHKCPYYNDNCPKCMTHTTPPDWEIEFDEKFITDDGDYSYVANDIEASTVKSFIRKEIASARAEERERIKKVIEGIKITTGSEEAKIGGNVVNKVILNAVSNPIDV